MRHVMAAVVLGCASAAGAAPFEIVSHTIDGGGAMNLTGGSFSLSGTVGQPDAGATLVGGAFELDGGFWPSVSGDAGCPADFAAPFGVLNFFDLSAFITLFNAGDPMADLAAPFGSFNFFDVAAYIALFNAGCP